MAAPTGNARVAYERELHCRIARESYIDYVEYVHNGRWQRAKHLEAVCAAMDAVAKGENRRLMLFLPPRHGKSMCVTETLPSYFLGRNPHKRVIELSYSDDLAQRFGKLNRDKLRSYGESIFGVKVSAEQATKTNWELAGSDGGMISAGIGGTVTGYGADLMIIDDPIKNRLEAESPTYRKRVWEEYQSTVATRLQARGSIIVILTRWHEDDLAGRLLNPEYGQPKGWEIISLPAMAESGDLLNRAIDEPLWPDRGYDAKWLADKKREVGEYAWSSLYQQKPSPPAGGMFKRAWWQYWHEQPSDLFDYIQSWDLSFKGKDDSDYVVGQVWARSRKCPAIRYLLDQVRGRMSFTEALRAVVLLSGKWRQTTRKLVEDAANGPAVIDALRRKIPGILPVTPRGGKIARAFAATPAVEAGNVYIPSPAIAPWVNDYVEEHAAFPGGANDDQVDATTQANAYYNDNQAFNLNALIS